jgi:5'-3' exonuclease
MRPERSDVMAVIDVGYLVHFNIFATIAHFNKKNGSGVDKARVMDEPGFPEAMEAGLRRKLLGVCRRVGCKWVVPTSRFLLAHDCERSNNWRLGLFETYKADRKSRSIDPRALELSYTKLIPALTAEFGMSSLRHPRAEADDIVSIVVKNSVSPKIIVVSGDKDMLQLWGPNVSFRDFRGRNVMMDVAVQYGLLGASATVHPDDWVANEAYAREFRTASRLSLLKKVLLGDASDNIPGVKRASWSKAIELFRDRSWVAGIARDSQDLLHRNMTLIDMDFVPADIVVDVHSQLGILGLPS